MAKSYGGLQETYPRRVILRDEINLFANSFRYTDDRSVYVSMTKRYQCLPVELSARLHIYPPDDPLRFAIEQLFGKRKIRHVGIIGYVCKCLMNRGMWDGGLLNG